MTQVMKLIKFEAMIQHYLYFFFLISKHNKGRAINKINREIQCISHRIFNADFAHQAMVMCVIYMYV